MNRNSNRLGNNRVPMKASSRHILSGVLGIVGGLFLIWAAIFESIFVEDNGEYIAVSGSLIVVGVGIFKLLVILSIPIIFKEELFYTVHTKYFTGS